MTLRHLWPRPEKDALVISITLLLLLLLPLPPLQLIIIIIISGVAGFGGADQPVTSYTVHKTWHKSSWEWLIIKCAEQKSFQSPLESVGVVGYADVLWQVVPRLCSCDAEGAICKLQASSRNLKVRPYGRTQNSSTGCEWGDRLQSRRSVMCVGALPMTVRWTRRSVFRTSSWKPDSRL